MLGPPSGMSERSEDNPKRENERNREINRPGTKFRHGLQMLGPPSGMSERSEDNPPVQSASPKTPDHRHGPPYITLKESFEDHQNMQNVHFGQVFRVMLGIETSFTPVKMEFAADTTVVVPLATAGQGPLQVNKLGFFLQYHL